MSRSAVIARLFIFASRGIGSGHVPSVPHDQPGRVPYAIRVWCAAAEGIVTSGHGFSAVPNCHCGSTSDGQKYVLGESSRCTSRSTPRCVTNALELLAKLSV